MRSAYEPHAQRAHDPFPYPYPKKKLVALLSAESYTANRGNAMTINRFKGIERQQLLDERALRKRELLDPHRNPSSALLEAWAPVEDELRQAVDELTFRIWLAPLHPHSLSAGTWRLACHERTLGWLQGRFHKLIAACAKRPVVFVICDRGFKEER